MANFVYYFFGFVIFHHLGLLISMDMLRKFVHLLAIEHGQRHPLSYYSQQLCISPHYLSVAVSKYCGHTPKSLMDRSVIAEIKAKLRHTDLSIQQIADNLHFPSCSFLCKYFKKHEGCTPSEYRGF